MGWACWRSWPASRETNPSQPSTGTSCRCSRDGPGSRSAPRWPAGSSRRARPASVDGTPHPVALAEWIVAAGLPDDLVVTSANAPAAHLLGVGDGDRLSDVLPPATLRLWTAACRRALVEGTPQPFRTEVVPPGAAEPRQLAVTLGLVSEPEGDRPARVTFLAEDITSRHHLRTRVHEREAQLRALLEAAPVILFELDEAGVFTFAEGRGLALSGLRSGDLVGESVYERYRFRPSGGRAGLVVAEVRLARVRRDGAAGLRPQRPHHGRARRRGGRHRAQYGPPVRGCRTGESRRGRPPQRRPDGAAQPRPPRPARHHPRLRGPPRSRSERRGLRGRGRHLPRRGRSAGDAGRFPGPQPALCAADQQALAHRRGGAAGRAPHRPRGRQRRNPGHAGLRRAGAPPRAEPRAAGGGRPSAGGARQRAADGPRRSQRDAPHGALRERGHRRAAGLGLPAHRLRLSPALGADLALDGDHVVGLGVPVTLAPIVDLGPPQPASAYHAAAA